MAKRYLVKEISVATEKNKAHQNTYVIHYCGKDDKEIGRAGTYRKEENYALSDEDILKFGYMMEHDAIKSYTFRHPHCTFAWVSATEIIEVEV